MTRSSQGPRRHRAAACADETVARDIEGTRGEVGIGLQGKRAHAGEGQDAVGIAVLGPDDEHALLSPGADFLMGECERMH